jgi:3-dehydrotetronate 4-kinase
LPRVLQAQTEYRVGLVDYKVVQAGQPSIKAQFASLQSAGVGIAVLDVISNGDLIELGAAVKDLPLVTAGSGLAIGLPANFGVTANPQAAQLPTAQGHQAIIAGSCSRATQAQVAAFIKMGGKAFRLDPVAAHQTPDYVQQLALQARDCLKTGPVLVYSTDSPEALKSNQAALGALQLGEKIEGWLAAIAQVLWQGGVRQWVVAGGETSGAVVQALALNQLRIGLQVDPGVPWCYGQSGLDGQSAHICLKSGNFGGEDFFSKVFGVLS